MEYICSTFSFHPKSESYCDVLASLLGDLGYDSFEIADSELKAYIPSTTYSKTSLDELLSNFPIPKIEISYVCFTIDTEDWNQKWESSFTPIFIDDLVHIHSSDYPSSQSFVYDITINPCMTFGSGSHSTTRMVIQMLLKSDLHGKKVLDLGCGTGILGICSKLGGCYSITALDTDSQSIENTKKNFNLNNVKAEKISLGSIDSLPPEELFDIILANIHLNVHLMLMEKYVSHLHPGGTLILSGFFSSDIPKIKSSCDINGLFLSESNEEGEWSALKFTKPITDPYQ